MPKLKWEKMGRSWYAHVGRLSMSVKKLKFSGNYVVDNVFGDNFCAMSLAWTSIEDAQEGAEAIALRYAGRLSRWREKVTTVPKKVPDKVKRRHLL